jgi:hypothetical protein
MLPRRSPAWVKALTGIRWGEIPRANGSEIAASVCILLFYLLLAGNIALHALGHKYSDLGTFGEYTSFAAWPLIIAAALLSLEGRSRMRRQARWPFEGRCAKCGYELATIPTARVCPECGYPASPLHRPDPPRG